jgi:hypothetical protein
LQLFDVPHDKETPDEPRPPEARTVPDRALAEPAHTPLLQNTPQEPSGEHFVAWLRQRIASHTLIINDAKALVHTVADTAYLVSPGIFQRYVQEHPVTANYAKQEGVGDWQWIQKRFEKLGLHRKQENGLNLWNCEVSGPRKTHRLHGYLLKDPQCLFDDVPPNNPHLSLA